MKCKKHPKYGAIRRPRTACEVCWRMYIEGHPKPLIEAGCFWDKSKSKFRLKIRASKDAPWH